MKHAYFVCLFLCLTVTFSARPASAATEKVLHSFQAYRDGDGSEANASLTADGAGNFYGTTPYGDWDTGWYLNFRQTAREAGMRPSSTASRESCENVQLPRADLIF